MGEANGALLRGAAEGFPQDATDHEGRWMREMWQAFGCATNPDDFKRSVRDAAWAQMLEWVKEQTRQQERAHQNGRDSGYQAGLRAARGETP